LVLSVFVAQQSAVLPVPPPDVDHVEPVALGQAGQEATRMRGSARAVQSPLIKRLPALPALVAPVDLAVGTQTLARTVAPREDGDEVSPLRIQRRILLMDSDEPPRG
jgi:hypothetical protein